jgi:hypothetical protein
MNWEPAKLTRHWFIAVHTTHPSDQHVQCSREETELTFAKWFTSDFTATCKYNLSRPIALQCLRRCNSPYKALKKKIDRRTVLTRKPKSKSKTYLLKQAAITAAKAFRIVSIAVREQLPPSPQRMHTLEATDVETGWLRSWQAV